MYFLFFCDFCFLQLFFGWPEKNGFSIGKQVLRFGFQAEVEILVFFCVPAKIDLPPSHFSAFPIEPWKACSEFEQAIRFLFYSRNGNQSSTFIAKIELLLAILCFVSTNFHRKLSEGTSFKYKQIVILLLRHCNICYYFRTKPIFGLIRFCRITSCICFPSISMKALQVFLFIYLLYYNLKNKLYRYSYLFLQVCPIISSYLCEFQIVFLKCMTYTSIKLLLLIYIWKTRLYSLPNLVV